MSVQARGNREYKRGFGKSITRRNFAGCAVKTSCSDTRFQRRSASRTASAAHVAPVCPRSTPGRGWLRKSARWTTTPVSGPAATSLPDRRLCGMRSPTSFRNTRGIRRHPRQTARTNAPRRRGTSRNQRRGSADWGRDQSAKALNHTVQRSIYL